MSFETPLMFAARVGNVHIVSLLLGAGANPSFQSNNGKTVVDYVDFAKFPEMETVLQQHKSGRSVYDLLSFYILYMFEKCGGHRYFTKIKNL